MKIGRNDLCWCGSGKKFKKCHWNREMEDPPNFQQQLVARKSSYGKKYCLHPNAGKECQGNIVRAHTIQRSGGLTRIAENGHVYTFFPDHAAIIEGDDPLARLVGVKNASTFTGFCSFHDNATFELIEKNSFLPTKEYAFLLGYRAICRELFGKKAQLEMIPILRENDKGRSPNEQVRFQDLMNYWEIGIRWGLRQFNSQKSLYDIALLNKDYSQINFYVVQLGSCPDFMCSGAIQPYYDFAGRQIQSLLDPNDLPNSIGTDLSTLMQDITDTNDITDVVAFSVIATDDGGAVVFTWMGGSPVCEQLIESLDSLSDNEITHAIVRFAFHYFWNIFASPPWWNSLNDKYKQNLLIRQRDGGISDFNPSCLTDDGVRAVSWNVKKRVKRMKC